MYSGAELGIDVKRSGALCCACAQKWIGDWSTKMTIRVRRLKMDKKQVGSGRNKLVEKAHFRAKASGYSSLSAVT